MNNKTKIMLGLSALTAGTLAAGATGTLAWFTTNKTATAVYNKITAQGTQGNLNISITGVTDAAANGDEGKTTTATSSVSKTADVSSTNGLTFAQPDWKAKAGNSNGYYKVKDVSTEKGFFTQYIVSITNKGEGTVNLYLDGSSTIGGVETGSNASLQQWTRVAIIVGAEKENGFLKTTKTKADYLFQKKPVSEENATKYVAPTKDAGDALTLLDCDPTPVNSFETVASATDEALAKQIVKENVVAGETVKVGVAVWLEGTMQDDQDLAKTGEISITLGFAAK